jgi:hypothetical protein
MSSSQQQSTATATIFDGVDLRARSRRPSAIVVVLSFCRQQPKGELVNFVYARTLKRLQQKPRTNEKTKEKKTTHSQIQQRVCRIDDVEFGGLR